jgi:hypothetical protein
VDWVFKYVSATRFSFSGRIVGAKITKGDWVGTAPVTQRPVLRDGWYGGPAIVDAGTHVVAANASTGPSFGIDFVLPSTGAYVRSVDTPARVTSLAVATSRIWFVTNNSDFSASHVGYASRDGTGSAVYDATGLPNPSQVIAILPDPGSPDAKAWVVWNDRGNTTYVKSYTPGATSGTGSFGVQASVPGICYSATLGADGRIYVAGFTDNNIPVFSPTEPPALATTLSLSYPCQYPGFIVQGLDAKLYFGDWVWNKICRIDDVVTGSTSQVGETYPTPQGIAVSAAGKVWVARDLHTVQALDTSGVTSNNIMLAIAVSAVYPLCLAADGALWYSDAAGLWKISQ